MEAFLSDDDGCAESAASCAEQSGATKYGQARGFRRDKHAVSHTINTSQTMRLGQRADMDENQGRGMSTWVRVPNMSVCV